MILDRNFVNVSQVDWEEHSHGNQFAAKRKRLSANAGAEKLGASLYEVPPGKAAWPRHYHVANEEALYILSGEGMLECGRNSVEVRAGDWVSLPPGERYVHKLVNTSDDVLRYLCVSTMEQPDVIVHPDSEKMGVFIGAAPGADDNERKHVSYHRVDESLDFWDGENSS